MTRQFVKVKIVTRAANVCIKLMRTLGTPNLEILDPAHLKTNAEDHPVLTSKPGVLVIIDDAEELLIN